MARQKNLPCSSVLINIYLKSQDKWDKIFTLLCKKCKNIKQYIKNVNNKLH